MTGHTGRPVNPSHRHQAKRSERETMMGRVVVGATLACIGVMMLVGGLLAATAGTSPRGWIAGHYSRTAENTYRAYGPPSKVAMEIGRKFRPTDHAYDPAGFFLRYSDAVVAVLADGRGSRIVVDNPDRGYRRWHYYVGGRWGGPGGRSSLFRGGGPGAGK